MEKVFPYYVRRRYDCILWIQRIWNRVSIRIAYSVEVGFASLIVGSDGSTTCPVEAFIAILTVRILDFGTLHGWIAPGDEELEERARGTLGECGSV